MKRPLVIAFLALAALATAQQASEKAGSLNLAQIKPRGSVPRGLMCGDAAEPPTGNLDLKVAALAKTTYSLGDPLIYTLRIENAGDKPIAIPWSPNPGVLPRDRYADKYVVSSFRVAAFTDCGAANLPESRLYGDPSVKKSWLELKPHQYAEITLKTKVEGLKACRDKEPTPVKLGFTMAQSAPRRGDKDVCVLSFFKGYHAEQQVEIQLAPAPPALKQAKGK